MDEADKRLFDLFAQKKNLTQEEPTFAAAFAPAAEKLEEARDRARAIAAEGPAVELPEADRTDLAIGRFPALQGVLELLGAGVAKHAKIAAEIDTRPGIFEQTAALDRALGRLVWAGQLLAAGGESGALLTAAAAQGLCQAALRSGADASQDPRRGAEQRHSVTALLAEPARIDKTRRDAQAKARETVGKATAASQAEIGQAQESAAMARVIEAFLDSIRRQP